MKAKFINESRKYPMKYIELDPEIQSKFRIPDWALYWNGIDIPEGSIYVDDSYEVGDVYPVSVEDSAVVIYKDEFGTIATKAVGLNESIYTTGELTDNEFLDELYAKKDELLDAMEDAQEFGYPAENMRMIGQELAEVENAIELETMNTDELRDMEHLSYKK